MQVRGSATANPAKSSPLLSSPMVMVGPCAAYHKGGVAYFTSRLAAAFAQLRPTRLLSWKELYPRWLLSRDLDTSILAHHPADKGAELMLSYSNPWSWRRTAAAIRSAAPDTVVLNWVHPVHAPIYAYLLHTLKRSSAASRIVICHNIEPHERFFGDTFLVRFALRSATALVVHSEHEAQRARTLFPQLRVKRLRMPRFNPFSDLPDTIPSEHPPLLLYFGAVRRYKGIDILLRAMPEVLTAVPHCRLAIAGEAFGSHAQELQDLAAALGLTDSVTFDLRYVPEAELAERFAGVSVVVLPFREVTQSASLSLAISSGLPVVTTKLPALSEAIEECDRIWVATPDDPASLASAIVSALQTKTTHSKAVASADDSWNRYASELCALAGAVA